MECIGGPYDGETFSTRIAADFLWTDGRRCYKDPGEGRVLYRKARRVGRRGGMVLLYAQHAYALCGKCGAYNARQSSDCSLCGATLGVTA